MGKLFRLLNRVRIVWLILVLAGILAFVMLTLQAVNGAVRAASKDLGGVVGIAVGSFQGITKGIHEGYQDGTDEGLSAEDTTAEIENNLERIGKLEVLAAGVSLTNFHELGEAYAKLQLLEGTVHFVVDLDPMWLTYDQNTSEVTIHLPLPEPQLEINWESSKILAEKQNFDFQISTEDAVEAFFNSKDHLMEKYRESISNYDTLSEIAQETAVVQVENLVRNINGNVQNIVVELHEMEGAG